ncbi:MAG: metallophosphoesterase family protein [Acidimicrobiales bacterium]
MLTILHTADWQIGKLFGQFAPEDAALLADARFQAIERLAKLGRDRQVDLILVAGDVFDAQTVTDRTLHRAFQALNGFPGPWVLIPGNHDAALTESVWTRARRLQAVPPQVHLCLRPEPLILHALSVAVLPAPLTQRHTYSDLTDWFRTAETPPGYFRVGVAHGSVQGILAEGIDSSNPIGANRALEARLDYLALGDWHGTKAIDAHTWYSGTPETDRFKANDSGQALLITITAPGTLPAVVPQRTGQYRWQAETRALAVPSDLEALIAWLAALGPTDVVQLTVSGSLDLAAWERLDAAVGAAQGRTRTLDMDASAVRLTPTDDELDALRADGYLGEVLTELRAGQAGSEGTLCRDALTLLTTLLRARPNTAGSDA